MGTFKSIYQEQKLTEEEKKIKNLIKKITQEETTVFDTFNSTNDLSAKRICLGQLAVYQQIKVFVKESLSVQIYAPDYYAKALHLLNNPPTLRR